MNHLFYLTTLGQTCQVVIDDGKRKPFTANMIGFQHNVGIPKEKLEIQIRVTSMTHGTESVDVNHVRNGDLAPILPYGP